MSYRVRTQELFNLDRYVDLQEGPIIRWELLGKYEHFPSFDELDVCRAQIPTPVVHHEQGTAYYGPDMVIQQTIEFGRFRLPLWRTVEVVPLFPAEQA